MTKITDTAPMITAAIRNAIMASAKGTPQSARPTPIGHESPVPPIPQ